MTSRQEPAVQRRRLRIALRDARQQRRLTQKEVADALDWSPSKLIRIENGSVTISRSDLLALLSHYGIDNREQVEELLAMAQAAKKQSWNNYRDVLTNEFLVFLEFEAAASLIRSFQPFGVPGLLQTEEYAQVFIQSLRPDLPSEAVGRLVEARMERQEIFNREEPPEAFFILDEAALRRRVGQGKVMVRQLERLKDAATHPSIHIQVLPFSAGVRAGITEPFVVLDFSDPADDDLLYIERGKYVSRDNPEEVERYNSYFFALEDVATPRGRIAEVLDRLIEQFEGGGAPLADEDV